MESFPSRESVIPPFDCGELAHADTKIALAWILETHTQSVTANPELRAKIDSAVALLSQGLSPDSTTLAELGGTQLVETLNSIERVEAQIREEYKIPQRKVTPSGELTFHVAESPRDTEEIRTLIVAPGSFTGPLQAEDFAVAAAMNGSTVVVPEMFTADNHRAPELPHEQRHMTDLIRAYSASVEETVLAVSEDEPAVDLLGYSMGAAAVVNVALRYPERVGTVILVNPVGITHIDEPYIVRIGRLLKGSLDHARQVATSGIDASQQYQKYADWCARQQERGRLELLELFNSAARIDITPLITELKDKGITVQIILSEDDKLFTIDNAEHHLDDIAGIGSAEYSSARGSSNVVQIRGGHTVMGEKPEMLAEIAHDLRVAS